MAIGTQKISPCLWFDTQAEEAANFYAAIFKNSRIHNISHYTKAGRDIHGKEPGVGTDRRVRTRRPDLHGA